MSSAGAVTVSGLSSSIGRAAREVDGDADFNFEANKEWHEHLTKLGIKNEFIIVPGAKHSATEVYDAVGQQVMQFHVESFRQSGALKAK